MSKSRMLILIGLLALYGVVVYFAQSHKINQLIDEQIDVLSIRVAMDLERLPIADPLFHYAGNQDQLEKYVQTLNMRLGEKNARVRVLAINSSTSESDHANRVVTLSSAHQDFNVVIDSNTRHQISIYILAVLAALGVLPILAWANGGTRRSSKVEIIERDEPFKLVVDLYSKSISTSANKQNPVQLANKPLCFYLALVEFCDANPDTRLSQNKEMPEELLKIADKYFYRLIELGHTIRKRPNFSNSLEKTLSEIRAALDEVLLEYPEHKSTFYPPKAHGEGSRSKLHSYGIKEANLAALDIVGK
ncbi:hypothetical protein ACSLBF_17500 (plasmid) [Pseudoalteromonas sp. T1lg65]|uniref:hypothetical protein n=1 Tax=Pseudoalteromonas sp. T1lg65 TaxID=2077101 RepID=UPI003F791A2E